MMTYYSLNEVGGVSIEELKKKPFINAIPFIKKDIGIDQELELGFEPGEPWNGGSMLISNKRYVDYEKIEKGILKLTKK